jgi:hypothetical protein
VSQQDADARFLVVGEELAVKFALLAQQRLDGLWNERFWNASAPPSSDTAWAARASSGLSAR